MSIRQKLLSTADTFLIGIANNTLEAFGETFGDLFEQIREGVLAGSLSLEDQQLAYKVAEMIQELGTGLDTVHQLCEMSQVNLQEQVDGAMAASISSASAFINDPQSQSSSPSPQPDFAPTPESSPSRPSPLSFKQPKKRNCSPESSANFSLLRAWFIENLEHPFPTKIEKKCLMEESLLTVDSINLWFTNMRRRSGWSAAQANFASGDPIRMRSLVKSWFDASASSSDTQTLTPEFIREIGRIQGYVSKQGQEQVRSYLVGAIQAGVDAAKGLLDEHENEEVDSGAKGDDDTKDGGRGRYRIKERVLAVSAMQGGLNQEEINKFEPKLATQSTKTSSSPFQTPLPQEGRKRFPTVYSSTPSDGPPPLHKRIRGEGYLVLEGSNDYGPRNFSSNLSQHYPCSPPTCYYFTAPDLAVYPCGITLHDAPYNLYSPYNHHPPSYTAPLPPAFHVQS